MFSFENMSYNKKPTICFENRMLPFENMTSKKKLIICFKNMMFSFEHMTCFKKFKSLLRKYDFVDRIISFINPLPQQLASSKPHGRRKLFLSAPSERKFIFKTISGNRAYTPQFHHP